MTGGQAACRLLGPGLPDRNKKLSQNLLQKIAKFIKFATLLEMVASLPKHLILSLEISRLKLFHLSPCILPESV